jgi:hypothetical protein
MRPQERMMIDICRMADRLRGDANWLAHVPLQAEVILPRLYPVSCIRLPALTVAALRDWFTRHAKVVPSGLAFCRDRRLRGGIVAWRGSGFLFADRDDSEAEYRFTFAHEASHFLQDHLYPRQDVLDRFGPTITPVLDGLRPATREERVDALLARTTLTMHTHLLDRTGAVSPALHAVEDRADAFACEMLAPRAALENRFPKLVADRHSVAKLQEALVEDFGLPVSQALAYAQTLVVERGEPIPLLNRLGLT